MSYIAKIKDSADKHSQRYLWMSIAVFIVLFVALAAKRYYYFDYNNADLSIFSQTLFNTLHGRWFQETLTINNYLADHFSPILILLVPFYAIKAHPFTLLVLQVVITALSAWPIYYIIRNKTKNNIFAYLASLLWLVNPLVHRQAMYEFHALHMMMFLFFWSFYFYQKRKNKLLLLIGFLALLVREDVALVFFGLACFDFFVEKNYKRSTIIFLISLLYFIFAIFAIRQFSPSDNYKFVSYYDWAGGNNFVEIIWSWLTHPVAVFSHILSLENIFIIFYLFLIFVFVPLFAKRYLLISIFPLFQYIMTASGISSNHIYMHYVSLLLPGFFLAYIFGLYFLLKHESKHKLNFIYQNKIFFATLFIFSVIFCLVFVSPIFKIIFKKYPKNYHENRQYIVDMIPRGASLAANPPLLTRFSSSQELYDLNFSYYGKTPFAERDFTLPQVDYIFIDMVDFLATINGRNSLSYWKLGDPLSMPDHWEKTLADYNLIYAKDDLYLWKNKKLQNDKILQYFEYRPIDLSNANFINDWSIEKRGDINILKIEYNYLPSNAYIIRFYQDNFFWEMPFDYGLYSLARKNNQQTLTVYYYPNDQVDYFELYHYKGYNILGDRNNIDFLIKRKLVFNKTHLAID